MGSQVVLDVAVFVLDFDQALGVLHGGGDFAPVADDSRIGGQRVDGRLVHGGHGSNVESLESGLKTGPLVADDFPGQAALKDGFGHNLKIVVQTLGNDLFRGFVIRRMYVLGGHNYGAPD